MKRRGHNLTCLICNETFAPIRGQGLDEDRSSLLNKQLNVIFILRNLLEVPSERLQAFLTFVGNPEEWEVRLCPECQGSVRDAREVHEELVGVLEKFRVIRGRIVEKVKESCRRIIREGKGDVEKEIGVREQCRDFVFNHNFESLKNPFILAFGESGEEVYKSISG